MRQIIREEKQCGGIFDKRGEEGIVEESFQLSYEIYSEGFYCTDHFSVRIEEKELCCTPEFIQRLVNLNKAGGE